MALLGDSRCGISPLRWRAGWRAVAGPGVDINMLTDTHIKLKKRPDPCMCKRTQMEAGQSRLQADSHMMALYLCLPCSAPQTAPLYIMSIVHQHNTF